MGQILIERARKEREAIDRREQLWADIIAASVIKGGDITELSRVPNPPKAVHETLSMFYGLIKGE